MRIAALLPLVLIGLVVAVSGCNGPTHEQLTACSVDADCVCGMIIGKDQCYVGHRAFIEVSDRCFKLCYGDPGRKAKCLDNKCSWVKVKEDQPDFPVADIIYSGIPEDTNVTEITVKNTGPVPFSPLLKLEILWDNISIYNTSVQYDTIDVHQSQKKQISINPRDMTGDWEYKSKLFHSDGSLINQTSSYYYKPPPPELSAFMFFHLKPRYKFLNNVSVGVRNTGNMSFVPLVHMTIYKGDMNSIYSDSKVYPEVDAGKNVTENFGLPPLENITYYLDFILKVENTEEVLEHINLEVLLGTW